MQVSVWGVVSEVGWSSCAATSPGRPWQRSASVSEKMGSSCSSSSAHGLRAAPTDGTVALVFERGRPQAGGVCGAAGGVGPSAPEESGSYPLWSSMGCLLRLIAGGASSFRMGCAGRRRLGAPPAKTRKQSGKPPGFDERWVPWEDLIHRVCGRDVVSCPACGCRIWLVDQVVDPFSAQLELAVMGLPAQLVAFRPARGPPESLLP